MSVFAHLSVIHLYAISVISIFVIFSVHLVFGWNKEAVKEYNYSSPLEHLRSLLWTLARKVKFLGTALNL